MYLTEDEMEHVAMVALARASADAKLRRTPTLRFEPGIDNAAAVPSLHQVVVGRVLLARLGSPFGGVGASRAERVGALLGVVGHEVRHLTQAPDLLAHAAELDADDFAARFVARCGYPMRALSLMLWATPPSTTHPDGSLRWRVVQNAWLGERYFGGRGVAEARSPKEWLSPRDLRGGLCRVAVDAEGIRASPEAVGREDEVSRRFTSPLSVGREGVESASPPNARLPSPSFPGKSLC